MTMTTTTMTTTKTLLVIASLSLLGACGRPFDVVTPRRFVQLEEATSGYDYRATTADGVVIGIRAVEVDRDLGGDLAFWVEAVEQRMRRIGGYALLERKDVAAGGGVAGRSSCALGATRASSLIATGSRSCSTATSSWWSRRAVPRPRSRVRPATSTPPSARSAPTDARRWPARETARTRRAERSAHGGTMAQAVLPALVGLPLAAPIVVVRELQGEARAPCSQSHRAPRT